MTQGPDKYRCVYCRKPTTDKDGIATADGRWFHDLCHQEYLREKASKRVAA